MSEIEQHGDVWTSVDDEFVATVEIRRPPHNYFDLALIEDLATAFEAIDASVRDQFESPEFQIFIVGWRCSGQTTTVSGASGVALSATCAMHGLKKLHRIRTKAEFFHEIMRRHPFQLHRTKAGARLIYPLDCSGY